MVAPLAYEEEVSKLGKLAEATMQVDTNKSRLAVPCQKMRLSQNRLLIQNLNGQTDDT